MWQNQVLDFLRGALLRLSWLPYWTAGALAMLVVAGLGILLHRAATRLALRVARHRSFVQMLILRAQRPSRIALVLFLVAPVVPGAGFGPTTAAVILHFMLLMMVLLIGWASMIAVQLAADSYLRRFRTDVDDNLLARKHVTQVRILSRAADTLIAVVAVSAALMTIPAVRQYGLSLFASAGAAGLVVGLSARPLLTNLIAGIQIAVTQPIRVEDAVLVEGEYGWVEEIGSTYVVLRLWDLRRMIVPLSQFIEKPFQNWTHTSADLLGSVMLYVDWTVPVERLRQRLTEVLRASRLWDGRVAVLQVTDARPEVVELRALMSARDAGRLWDLRCEVREKLIAFLQAELPHALPRARVEMGPPPAPGAKPELVQAAE